MTKIDTEKALNTIRFLSADGVQVANSGHTGLPMGAAALAYVIFMHHLKHNPKDPSWPDRDRFVLSGGHGSMLLYTMLYLTGYDISLEDLKNFRQLGSKTAGHPEWGLTPGVETTTGPLGQGFANGVGMAIAEELLASQFNLEGNKILDHYTYGIVTDGDLMEGISSESASLAGNLQLGKLIYLYDDNDISIEGSTDITFTEDVAQKFESFGWHVLKISNGQDVEALDQAIFAAKSDPRPSLIICKTVIGYGLPTKAGTAGIHGSPAGWDELKQAKENAQWPTEPLFYVHEDILAHFRQSVSRGEELQKTWQEKFESYSAKYPNKANEFKRRFGRQLPKNWEDALPVFLPDQKGMASRSASGKTINAIAKVLPELIGGSADLAPSNNTWIEGFSAFSKENREGRNLHFGVREMSMAAETNGIFVHGGLIPFAGTFLVFSDYMRGSIRVGALSHMGSIWVLTHDSIGVGEDGPTHQPVEHVMSLRLMPNLVVIRPCDANETVQAWKYAIEHRDKPTALILSRQNLPTLDRSIFGAAEGLHRGAYVLYDSKGENLDLILMATGSEVQLTLRAALELEKENLKVRVVSFPSWEIFEEQRSEYKAIVLPEGVKNRISIEAGVTTGWHKYVGEKGICLGIDSFGLSGPGDQVMDKFGFNVQNIVNLAKSLFK